MLSSSGELSEILQDALKTSGTRQRPALRRLVLIAKDRRTSETDFATIWRELQRHLPVRNITKQSSVDFLWPSEITAIYRRNTRLLQTLYRPLVDAIAANPATSPDILREIAYYAPQTFCANSALPGLLKVNSDWIRSLSGAALGEEGHATLMRLLRCENAPKLLVELIAQGAMEGQEMGIDLLTLEAQRHIAIAGESEGITWIGEVDEYWCRYALSASGLEKEYHQEFAVAGLLPAWGYEDKIPRRRTFQAARDQFLRAVDPNITSAECATLAAKDESIAVRLAATINPQTPEIKRHRPPLRDSEDDFGYPDLAPMTAILRKYAKREDSEAITLACREVLLQLRDRHSSDMRYGHKALQTFLWIMSHPQIVDNAAHAQEAGEYWVVLLAWTLGVQPDASGRWNEKEQLGLEALAKDGNRWVRAAAQARLKNPSVSRGWGH
jgi:hypothetical protein